MKEKKIQTEDLKKKKKKKKTLATIHSYNAVWYCSYFQKKKKRETKWLNKPK